MFSILRRRGKLFDLLAASAHGLRRRSSERWPVILFLHGAGERDSTAVLVKKHGIARIADEEPDFPFIAVSPQCPFTHWWSDFIPELAALLDEAQAIHAVDADRVDSTGLSMGVLAVWACLATEYPERFAAAALICGAPPWDLDMASRAVRRTCPSGFSTGTWTMW